jgi:succinyl-CoA synthetase beta subunit
MCDPGSLQKSHSQAIPAVSAVLGEVLAPLVSSLPLEIRPTIEAFLANCLAVFDDLDATLLEMNPFTFDSSGKPFPLDIRMVSCTRIAGSLLTQLLSHVGV